MTELKRFEIGSFLTIFANCEKRIDHMLKDVSQIKISGGCEVFAEGCITFVAMGKDKTMVQVDNSGRYFYDETSNPIPSFGLKIDTEQLSMFSKPIFSPKNKTEKFLGSPEERE